MDPNRTQDMMNLFAEFSAERLAAGLLDSETRRHTDNLDLFEAMLREAYPDITMIVAGHHIMFMREGQPLANEVPAADTLLFDHTVAQRVWGKDWEGVLNRLALEPAATRDALVRTLFFHPGRKEVA